MLECEVLVHYGLIYTVLGNSVTTTMWTVLAGWQKICSSIIPIIPSFSLQTAIYVNKAILDPTVADQPTS